MSARPLEKPVRLVEVAKNHFLKFGIESANLRSIAQEAGLTTGAVYHHFAGKDELFVEVCLQGYEILLQRLNAAAQLTQGQPPKERILGYLDAYWSFFVENGGYFALIDRLERDPDSLKVAPELRQQVQAAIQRMMDLIRAAIGKDLPGCAAKAELLAAMGQGFIHRMRNHTFEHAGVTPGEVRRLCGDVVECLVCGAKLHAEEKGA